MAKKRWAGKTAAQRSEHMRRMGEARGQQLAADAEKRRIDRAATRQPARRKRS